MLLIFVWCLIFSVINAYDRGFHKLDTVVERFRYGDYDFVFYSKSANWAEAFTICKATHSRLAVVNSMERANFLAQALSQTKVGFEDMWIGGRFTKDRWRWVSTGKPLPKRVSNFPPWLSYPTRRGKNCLSLDRKNHWEPIFVEKQCSNYIPFICEESVSDSLDNAPSSGNEVTISNRQYILYHARATWEEALAFCKQTESRLATIPNLDAATKLAAIMKRSRPPFETAWIGAKKGYTNWIWVATEETLPNETRKNGFPPWKFDHPIDKMKGCTLLDHHPCLNPYHIRTSRIHHCEEPVFIEEECSLKKDFVCEIVTEEAVEQDKPILVTVDQITYIFSNDTVTWVDAIVACENFNMTLATPETDRQWETIIDRMGNMQHEFDHIWLGGRWIPDEWIWLNNRSIPLRSTNSTYPPWCPTIDLHEEDEDCLNLDRDYHNIGLIYGLNCSVKQHYVCQLDAYESVESLSDPSIRNEFERHSGNLTHFEAVWACKLNNSHLAVVNNIQLAKNLALMLPRDTHIWVDAVRKNRVWYWHTTGEVIPDVPGEDGYPPWESFRMTLGQKMCLAMKSGHKEIPYFVEKPCEEKLNYLCQFDKKELPQPDVILELNDIKYYFYKKGVPWSEAMSICNSGDLYLVNVGNLALANFLLSGMEGSQWTSGKQVLPSSWTWITSGSKLPHKIKLGYPPWEKNSIANDKNRNCLLLDKINDNSTFVGENCMKNHSFVCIDKIFMYNETEIDVGNITISVQDIITSISKAKKACIDSGKSVVNFAKLDYEKLINILKMENVKSLWVDVVHNTDGKWVYADTLQEFHTEIDFPSKDSNPTNDSKSCLTLQLTSNEKLILIPSLCSDFSRIICMSENKEPVPPLVEHVVNNSVTIIAKIDTTVIGDANLVCNDLGGEVIKGALLDKAIAFFKTLHSDYKAFWLGASYENNKWIWNDGTDVNLKNLPNPKFEDDKAESCLIFDRKSNQIQAANCEKEKYSTVCEQVIVKCPPKKTKQSSVQWTPEQCVLQPLTAGAVCRASCKLSNLFGPQVHICNKGKWSYNTEPSCKSDKENGQALANLMQKQIFKLRLASVKSSFLFVLDIGIKRKEFVTILHMSKHLANLILLNDQRRVGIELYSIKPKMIDVMENNNCYLIHTIDVLTKRSSLSNSQPSYYNAFLTAEEKFADDNVVSGCGYLFFFAMRPDAGSMNRTIVVERLQKNVTIIVITVGDEINRSQLEEIASIKFDVLQLYSFTSMEGLQAASNILKTKSKIRSQDCPKDYAKGKYI